MKVYIIRYYISRIFTVLCAPWILLSSLLSIAYLSSEHVRLFKDIMNIICAYQRRTKIFCDAVSEINSHRGNRFALFVPHDGQHFFSWLTAFLKTTNQWRPHWSWTKAGGLLSHQWRLHWSWTKAGGLLSHMQRFDFSLMSKTWTCTRTMRVQKDVLAWYDAVVNWPRTESRTGPVWTLLSQEKKT